MSYRFFYFSLPALIILSLAACGEPEPKVGRLDRDYGFKQYRLGASLYRETFLQAKERMLDYEIIEYETFGSRFADQQLIEWQNEVAVFGAPVVKTYAGVLDGNIYAFLFQIESEDFDQHALQDSLYTYYGTPQSVTDTSMFSDDMMVRVHTHSWEADSVGLDFGRGDGFAEILVYDKKMRLQRLRVQQLMTRAQKVRSDRVNTLRQIGQVRFASTVPVARWRYRYRGDQTHVRGGSFGSIDYKYVEPFFDVQGESLFGVQMAFVNLSFVGGSDSLRSIEVRFDNTQGQTVGFMDMMRVMERKLGRHAYSDTLHTRKGGYRRAMWYGDDVTITLEENRFRPEKPDRADVLVQFELDREEIPWTPPALLSDEGFEGDSLGIANKDREVSTTQP